MADNIAVTAPLQRFTYDKGMHHLVIPPEVAKRLGVHNEQKSVRVIVQYPEGEKLHLALIAMPNGEPGAYVMVNAKLRKKYHLDIGDSIRIELSLDTSEFGVAVPEVLVEFLAQDEEAYQIFLNLTDGKKRSVIHAVSSATNH